MRSRAGEVLRAGASLIGEYGHHKGAYGDTESGFCAIGACRQAVKFLNEDDYFESAALDGLTKSVGVVHVWNDAAERTADEVTQKMRDVADHLDNVTP